MLYTLNMAILRAKLLNDISNVTGTSGDTCGGIRV